MFCQDYSLSQLELQKFFALREEANVVIAPEQLELFSVGSGGDTLLIFGLGPRLQSATLPPFAPTAEITERLITEEPIELGVALRDRCGHGSLT